MVHIMVMDQLVHPEWEMDKGWAMVVVQEEEIGIKCHKGVNHQGKSGLGQVDQLVDQWDKWQLGKTGEVRSGEP